MNWIIFIIFFVTLCYPSQDIMVGEISVTISNFGFFQKFNEPFDAKIIKYWPGTPCGTMATAAQTIALTNLQDTIKIISLCEISKLFKSNDQIIVSPDKLPEFQIDIVGDGSDESNIWKTKKMKSYFGKIILKE